MEKKSKIAIAITAIGAAIAGWFCFGRKKKQEKTVETQRTTAAETTEEKRDVVEEKKVEKPKKLNLPREIYVDALFESEDEWGELLDISRALQADKRVIHVCQNKWGRREFLEFKLHIPRNTEEGNWSLPRDVDYLRQINESIPKIEKIWGKKIKHPVIGYFVINVTTDNEEEKEKCLYCRIPREIFSKYAGDKGDGLIEFVRAAREGTLGEDAKFDIPSIEGIENIKKIRVEYIELMYSISIEITDDIKEVAREKGFETLKFLVNTLEIEGRGKYAETYNYDRVLFHVPNQPMEIFYEAEEDKETGKKKIIETEAYF